MRRLGFLAGLASLPFVARFVPKANLPRLGVVHVYARAFPSVIEGVYTVDGALYVATERGLYRADDDLDEWTLISEVPPFVPYAALDA